ncbi:hypothetical protein G6F50_014957 [Rhizopus delemar]|uniref:Uncharacterized protein n=1 Tax=Rhizopus delemar TaxID=936053 RepID=A0A9P7C5M2_9FUNG|nr:hypothetical protein G6F50_014957 [Rhizopus delemar]
MHASARGVVQDDVATRADALVHVAIDVGVAGGQIVRPTRMQGHHAGPGVVAAVDVVGNLCGLGRQMRVLAFQRHAPRRGDGHDHFAFRHGFSLLPQRAAAFRLGREGLAAVDGTCRAPRGRPGGRRRP